MDDLKTLFKDSIQINKIALVETGQRSILIII